MSNDSFGVRLGCDISASLVDIVFDAVLRLRAALHCASTFLRRGKGFVFIVLGASCLPGHGVAAIFTEHLLVTEEVTIGGVRQSMVVLGKAGTRGNIVSTPAERDAAALSIDEPAVGAQEKTIHYEVGSIFGIDTSPDPFPRAHGGFDNRAVFLTEPTVCPPTCPPEPPGEATPTVSDIVQITHMMDLSGTTFDFFNLDFLSDPNAGIGSRGPLDPPNVPETGALQEITAQLLDDIVDPTTGAIIRHGYNAGAEPFRVFIQSCSIPCEVSQVSEPSTALLSLLGLLSLATILRRNWQGQVGCSAKS